METFVQDLRYSFRTLAKAPGYTAVAVLTLALGVGANAAIFSVLQAVVLRDLPYRDPDRDHQPRAVAAAISTVASPSCTERPRTAGLPANRRRDAP
jgi:hypothetical protein